MEQAEREALVCLAAAQEPCEDLLCAFGAVEAWERVRSTPGAPQVAYEQVLEQAEAIGARVVVAGDDEWPFQVEELGVHDPSVLALWLRGRRLDLRQPVALTGSRAATAYGQHVAGQIAADLAEHQHTVIASLSFGIEAAALRAALAAAERAPVAVSCAGVDVVHPRSHAPLIEQLLATGTLVAERPPGTPPSRAGALDRARLLAALAGAVVLVEGSARSACREVARWARRLDRALLAVPGPVTSAVSALPHELIAGGAARLVTDGHDVREALAASITDHTGEPPTTKEMP